MKLYQKRLVSILLVILLCFSTITAGTITSWATDINPYKANDVSEAFSNDSSAVDEAYATEKAECSATPDEPQQIETQESNSAENPTDTTEQENQEPAESALPESGSQNNLSWTFDSQNGVFTVSGEGEIADYEYFDMFYPYSWETRKIVINEGITRIGSYTFSNFNNIEELILPSTLVSIGSFVFFDTKIERLVLPEGLEVIESMAFRYNNNIKEIVLPDSITTLGDEAFIGSCINITTLRLPKNLTYCGSSAFAPLYNLESFVIDSDNEYFCVEDGVLYNKEKTELIAYPCKKADSSFTVPSTVTKICAHAFEDCCNLEGIVFNDNLTVIESNAFYNCKNITGELVIPDNVSYIGPYAFSGMEGITSVKLPASLEEIAYFTFFRCYNLESIELPDGLKSIDILSFMDCYKLKSLNLPKSLEFFAPNSVTFCNALEEINVDEDNSYYCSQDGVLFNKDKTQLIKYVSTKKNSEYSIPDGVKEIPSNAFASCENLTSITVPDSVEVIGTSAFASCKNLTSLRLSNSITNISESMLSGCSSLETLTIPDGVTNIDSYAFYNCTSLKSITIPDGVTNIDSYAFYNCTSLKSITIPDSVSYIGYSAFSECTSLESVILPSGLNEISPGLFYNCTSLKSVTIPSNIDYFIGDDAFENCPDDLVVFCNKNSNVHRYVVEKGIKYQLLDGEVIYPIIYFLPPEDIAHRDLRIVAEINTYDSLIQCEMAKSELFYKGQQLYSAEISQDTSFKFADGLNFNVYEGEELILSQYFGWGNDFEFINNKVYLSYNNSWDSYDADSNFATGSCGENLTWTFDYITGVLTISGTGDMTGYLGIESKYIKSVVIEDGVTSLRSAVFRNCKNLKQISIPQSLQDVGYEFLDNSDSVIAVNVDPNSEFFTSVNGVLYNKSMTNLIYYPPGKSDESFDVHDSVTYVMRDAFNNCKELKSINIPASVGCIEYSNIFKRSDFTMYCTKGSAAHILAYKLSANYVLTDGDDDNCVSMYFVPDDEHAQDYTYKIELTLDGGYTKIYDLTPTDYKFAERNIYKAEFAIPGNDLELFYIHYYCYKDNELVCSIYEDVKLLSNCVDKLLVQNNEFGDYIDYNFNGENIVSGSCGENASWEFNLNTGTLSISGTGAVESKPWDKYSNKINYVNIESGITRLGNYSLSGTKIKSIQLPDTLDIIGDGVFASCTKLESIVIPDSVTCIGDFAFANCQKLLSVTIPASVIYINGYSVFNLCSKELVVNCYKNSTAHDYMKSSKFKYNLLDEDMYEYSIAYNYVTNEGKQSLIKKFKCCEDDIDFYVKRNMPNIENRYYYYYFDGYTVDEEVVSVNINSEKKYYYVSVDGKYFGSYGYKEKATVTLNGAPYTFYITGDVELISGITDQKEPALISFDGMTVTNESVTMELLSTANIDDFERMGVVFAASELSEDDIKNAVSTVTSDTDVCNSIIVHNSSVDAANESGSYQFTYSPYVSKEKATKTLFFYTFVVDTSGNVSISDAVEINLNNAYA